MPPVASGAIGPSIRATVYGPLLELLREKDAEVRLTGVKVLVALGPPPESERARVTAMLGENDAPAEVTIYAAHTLGQLGADAREAMPVLLRALAQASADVRPRTRGHARGSRRRPLKR